MTRTDDSERGSPADRSLGTGSDRPDSVSTWLVERVADYHGVDPFDLDERLYERIDPEALDELFASDAATDGRLTVQFAFAGVDVTVRRASDGDVTLRVAEASGCDSD